MTEEQEFEYLLAVRDRLEAEAAKRKSASTVPHRAMKQEPDGGSAESQERLFREFMREPYVSPAHRRAEEQAIGEWTKCFLQASSVSGPLDFRKRSALGSVPRTWEVVGPHRRADRSRPNADVILWSLLDRIEETLLQPATEGAPPFIYVRNPPRHGKTFCLDALLGAQEHADVLKIEISHNLLYIEEQESPLFARRHFWTRVAKQLLEQLSDDDVDPPPRAMLSEWESVARACPGIDAVPIVICADELSHLLKFQTWREGGVEEFFSSLARFQRAHMFECKPMRRLVMTGFDHHLTRGIASSGLRCITYAVRPLRYCEAQRLAQRLLFAYAKAKVQFPTALFWLVQTSPGLLGEWAHVAFEPSVARDAPHSVDAFDRLISSWRHQLVDELLPRRLQLVERFMCGCICAHCLAAALDLGIAVPRDVAPRDLPSRAGKDDCPCDAPVAANVLDCFTLVPYALYVLTQYFTRHGPRTEILKQLKQLFVVLFEVGASGVGRREDVLRHLRLEAEAAGWSSLASDGRGSYGRLAEPPAGAGARAAAGECLQRFVATALRLSALCKLEAKRRRSERAELTVGDLFPCQLGQAKSRPLKHGGTLTVIEATDERTLRAMLTGCAYDMFPVGVDEIIAKGDVIQRLAALRTHLTLVEKHKAVRFGADVGHLRTHVEQITHLTGPGGWRGQDAGILGVNATGTERLKRSGAFARAADILAEAEASLGGHTVRTGERGNCSTVVEQLRDAVYAVRAATQQPVSSQVQAALRFAQGAEGLALLAGTDAALVPDSWVETFTADPATPPAATSGVSSSPASFDAAMKQLEATLCGNYPQQDDPQLQLLLPRRVLGARLLTWVLEHALSTSLPPRGADGDEADPRPSALDMVFCRGDDAPNALLQQVAFPHPFPCCESKEAQHVKAAFLELCGSKPKPFLLCLSGDSSAGGCSLVAVGESPSRPAEKRPVVLVEIKNRGAPAAADWHRTEAVVAGEDVDAEAGAQNRVCSLVNDAELRQIFDFTLVFAGCAL
jgi:hypothetical protein